MKMRKNSLGTALITGGAKRIGCGISKKLAKMGYDLIIHYNNSENEAKLLQNKIIKDFGINCSLLKANLENLEEIKRMTEEIRANFENWNLLINNASIFYKSDFFDYNLIEKIEKNFTIHLKAPIILSKAMAENCRKFDLKGNIINMLDRTIIHNNTKYFTYLLSKKSLAEFTKIAALQLAPNIRVNAIAPGFILKSIDNSESAKEEREKLIKKIPLKIKGDKKNVNSAIRYILTNDFLTGQILFVDGGASIN